MRPGPVPTPQVWGLRRERMGSGRKWCQEPSRTGVGRTQPQGRRGASSSPSFWHVLVSTSGLQSSVPTRPHWLPCDLPALAAPAPTPSAGARLRPPCTGASLFPRGSEPGLPAALCSHSTPKPAPTAQLPQVSCLLSWETGLGAGSAAGGPRWRRASQGPGLVSSRPCTS